MKVIAILLTLSVAVSHIGILILEMFFWNHPTGHRIFSMTPEVAAASEVLAMNQGLYNGFLAAGIFGSATAKFTILFTQGLPALLALIAVLINREKFS